jgi:hypothetical protein
VRIPFLFVALASLMICPQVRAVDYSHLERTIRKEPPYQGVPRYALLLFGPEARLRVWVVVDGATVYLDRNADGDLTGTQERFVRTKDCAGLPISDADGKTRYVIDHVNVSAGREQAPDFLDVGIDIQGPLPYRQYGTVELRQRPGEAKVAHFHGPLTICPEMANWKVPADLALVTGGKPTELSVHVGTFSAEHGCWVVVRSHTQDRSAFPAGVFPVVDVEFPPKTPGGEPIRKRYELKQFC